MRRTVWLTVAGCSLVLASPALAHVGHGASGLEAGLAHPWSGMDHMLAMVAVGWAAAAGAGRTELTRLALLPLAFVLAMIAGALLAWGGLPVAWAEAGILASIGALAGLLVIGRRLALAPALVFAAVAALPHGAAHGAELPAGASALGYLGGFAASTATLHALGVIGGLLLARSLARAEPAARYVAAAAMAGFAIMAIA